MSKRYYTVVFEISDEEAWKQYGSQFTQSLAGDGPVHMGVEVAACGEGDAMSQADALQDHLVATGDDPDEIVRDWAEEHELDGDSILG